MLEEVSIFKNEASKLKKATRKFSESIDILVFLHDNNIR